LYTGISPVTVKLYARSSSLVATGHEFLPYRSMILSGKLNFGGKYLFS
jgi:hypothetical protein